MGVLKFPRMLFKLFKRSINMVFCVNEYYCGCYKNWKIDRQDVSGINHKTLNLEDVRLSTTDYGFKKNHGLGWNILNTQHQSCMLKNTVKGIQQGWTDNLEYQAFSRLADALLGRWTAHNSTDSSPLAYFNYWDLTAQSSLLMQLAPPLTCRYV